MVKLVLWRSWWCGRIPVREGLVRYKPGQASPSGIKCGSTEYGIQVTDDEYNSNEQTPEGFAQSATWSNLAVPASVVTRACDAPPAPVGLKATATSESTVDVTWTHKSHFSEYKIERKKSGDANWQPLTTVDASDDDAETKIKQPVSNLNCSTSYLFRIQGKGSGEDHAMTWGPWAAMSSSVTTLQCIGSKGSIVFDQFTIFEQGDSLGGYGKLTINWERGNYQNGVMQIKISSVDLNLSFKGIGTVVSHDWLYKVGIVVTLPQSTAKVAYAWCRNTGQPCTCYDGDPSGDRRLNTGNQPYLSVTDKLTVGLRVVLNDANNRVDLFRAKQPSNDIEADMLYDAYVDISSLNLDDTATCSGPGNIPIPVGATPTPAPDTTTPTPTPAAGTPTPVPVSTPTPVPASTPTPGPAPNQAPTFASSSYSASVSESLGTYSVILTMANFVSDPDAGDTLTYYITSGNSAGKFSIDYNQGYIVLAKKLDYDVASSYSLTVEVRDGNGGKASVPVTITVLESS